jgi:RHS repeat-associated protein
MVYDSLGRKIQMTDLDSGTWRYGYDGAGNLIWQDDPKSGAEAQHVQFCYDALNRPLRRCPWSDDAAGTHSCSAPCGNPEEEIRYFYDGNDGWAVPNAIGRLTRVEDAAGQFDVEEYDARGRERRVTRTIDVAGSATHGTFAYDYDTNDRLTSVTYPDGDIIFTDYDDSGQPTTLRSISTQLYVVDALYDVFGRPTEIQRGNGVVDTRVYGDHLDRHRLSRLKSELPGVSPSHLALVYQDRDNRGLLTALRDERNLTGELSNSADFTYDHMGRLLTFDSVHGPADRTYAYDPLGNITRHGDQYLEYSSTKPHQVTVVRYGSPTGPGVDISHDANGNRTAKFAQSYEYTKEDRLKTINAGGQTVTIAYDYQGRQVARMVGTSASGVTRYYGDLVETSNGFMTKWVYFGGQRMAMRLNSNIGWEQAALGSRSTWFALAPADAPRVVIVVARELGGWLGLTAVCVGAAMLLAPWGRRPAVVGIRVRYGHAIGATLLWTAGTLPWPLVLGPSPAAAQKGGGTLIHHYHTDHLGSTQVITDNTGQIIEQIRYSAYGEIRGRWNASNQPIGAGATRRYEFTGYETEIHSGLQYAGARFYDPTMGSFTSHDPVAAHMSPYSYVHWDPVNGTDPGGACELVCILAIAAVVGSVASSAIQAATNGTNVGEAVGNAFVGVGAGLVVQNAVIGPLSTAVPVLGPILAAAQIAYGAYSAVEGYRSGQSVQATFGAVLLAYGVWSATQSVSDGTVAQGANGSYGIADPAANPTPGEYVGDAALAGEITPAPNYASPGTWATALVQDVASFTRGVLIGGPVGIVEGTVSLGQGIVNLDVGEIGLSLAEIATAPLRYGGYGGLRWGEGAFLGGGRATGWLDRLGYAAHDVGFGRGQFHSANSALLRTAWTRHDLGLYGHLHRVLSSAVFRTHNALLGAP